MRSDPEILELTGETCFSLYSPKSPFCSLLHIFQSSRGANNSQILIMASRGVWLALLGVVTAQTTTGTSPTISVSAAFNGSSAPSPTAPVLQLNLNLEDVWDLLIGPVAVAKTTTVYEPSPVPSSSLIPPPPIYYSPFPTGQQVPLVPKNESWAFPEHFWYVCNTMLRLHSLTFFRWGVAGAAFQIEGAAKDEGRGPSVWDALSRVTNHIVDNSTADVADNVSSG